MMKMMARVLSVGVLMLLSISVAEAQCSGQFPAGTFCGNTGSSLGLPGPKVITPSVFQPIAGGTVIGNPTAANAVPIATPSPVFGIPGSVGGSLLLSGASSGQITVKPQSAAGTYNFNLPTAAGVAGQPLLSGGGGAAPMTFGTLAVPAGGTGQVSYSIGDILYGSGPTTLSKLGGNATTGIQYLSSTGTGTAATAPSWVTISGGDVTGAALTSANDTNVTLTLGGAPATSLLRAASITAGWTGTLSVSRGGTGLSSGTSGGVPYFSASNAMASSALLAANQIMLGGGAGGAPATLGSLGTATQVLHGNAAGAPVFGQVVGADIATNTVANSNLAQVGAATLKGNPTAATGNVQDFTIQGLSNLAAPNPALDLIPIYDHVSGTLKNVSVSAVAGTINTDVPYFPTVAAASIYAPVVAPSYLVTAYYDSSQIVSSGALYKNNGGTSGDITVTLSDGVTHVGFDVWQAKVSAASYGLNPSASAATNLAAIKSAIARTPVGGTTYVPPGSYTVDTSGGLSNAATINKSLKFQIDGSLTASFAAQQSNPPYIFNVTASYVTFFGVGALAGPGTFFVAPSSGDSVYPGLVMVNGGNYFDFSGITIKDAPQKGIFVVNSTNANLHDFPIIGGPNNYVPSTYVDPTQPNYGQPNPGYLGSYNAGIVFSGGGDHTVSRVRAGKDPVTGGAVVLMVFSGGDNGVSNNLKIVDNVATSLWEKLAYTLGSNHIISHNTIVGEFNGTYQTRGFTDVIRAEDGNSVLIDGNDIQNVTSGIQVSNATNAKIINNVILNTNINSINAANNGNTPPLGGPVDGVEITNNTITFNPNWVLPSVSAINVLVETNTSKVSIKNNKTYGYGAGSGVAIGLSTASGCACILSAPTIEGNAIYGAFNAILVSGAYQPRISSNLIQTTSNSAIVLQNSNQGLISNNSGAIGGSYAMQESGSSGNSYLSNYFLGASNFGILGLSSSSYGAGNRYTDSAILVGSVTLSTSSGTTTVPNVGVATNANILIQPLNDVAATKLATDGYYTGRNGTGLNIVNGNGNVAPAGAVMLYQIIQ